MQSKTIESGATILVTGAGGFVGRVVVKALRKAGFTVRAMTRKATNFEDAKNIIGDITNASDVKKAVEGMSAVVHLAARKSDEKDSEEVNVTGTKLLAEACKNAGVKRVINVSTQSAKLSRLGLYGKTKLASEKVMRDSGIPTITLRPSVVYSDEGGGILTTVLQFCTLPVVPMIGDGTIGFQPIHRDDLAAIIVKSLNKGSVGGTYDIGGTDRLTLRELTTEMQMHLGTKKMILTIPVPVAMLIARLTTWMRCPPVTVSNVLGGSEDVLMDIHPMLADFGITPRSFSKGLDRVFAYEESEHARKESIALLRYAYSACGWWEPQPSDIALYEQALIAHHVPTHRIDASVLRSAWILGGLDSVAGKTSVLRQKILIAAAVGECSPQTASFTLPKDHSIISIVGVGIAMTLRSAIKIFIGNTLRILRPSFTRRHVG